MRRRLTTLVAMAVMAAVMAAMMLAMAMPAFAVKVEETLVVCHTKPNGEVIELTVPFRAAAAHISHGDFIAPCEA